MTSHTLLIAEREIRERRFVFIAAAVAALLPYMALLLPGAGKVSRSDIGAVGVILSIIFAAALALIVGASLVGRELSERRLSFYFTRPLPVSSLWFGKLLAGIVLVVASFAIIAVPAVIVGGYQGSADWRFAVVAWFGILIALMLLAHTASTMVRSRSPLVALDLALLAGASTIGWFILRELLATFAVKAAGFIGVVIGVGVMLSMIAAGAWQLSRGRSEARRNHAALSMFLWPAVGVVLLITGGLVAWLLSAKPSDLIFPDMKQPASQWIYLTGKARGRFDYRPRFLVNAASGEAIKVPGVPAEDAVSRDGRTFAFVRSTSLDSRRGPFVLQLMRTGDDGRRMVETTIESGPMSPKTLSDDGRLFAAVRDGVVSVHDLEARRLLVSARLPERYAASHRTQMLFVSPTVLRIYDVPQPYARHGDGTTLFRAFELDLVTRSLKMTGEMRSETTALSVTANEDASRLIMQQLGDTGIPKVTSLIDGRTLQPIADLDAAVRPYRAVRFLSDGRLAVMEGAGGEGRRLTILDQNGRRLKTIDVAASGGSMLVGEAAPGKVVIGTVRAIKGEKYDHTTLLVDIDTGKTLRREEHFLVIAPGEGPWGIDPRQPRFDSRHVWILREHGAIWRWNPMTGEKSVILRTQT